MCASVSICAGALCSVISGSASGPRGHGARSTVSRRTASTAARKVPIMEEHFKTEAEKHAKWSASSMLWVLWFGFELI